MSSKEGTYQWEAVCAKKINSMRAFILNLKNLLQVIKLCYNKQYVKRLRGAVFMLKIYYGDMQECIYNTAVYFKNVYESTIPLLLVGYIHI